MTDHDLENALREALLVPRRGTEESAAVVSRALRGARQRRRCRRGAALGCAALLAAIGVVPLTLSRGEDKQTAAISAVGSPVQPHGPTGALAVTPSGSLLLAQPGTHQVLQMSPKGVWSVFAGTGRSGSAGDGAAASDATLVDPTALAVAPDSTVYVADAGSGLIRRIGSDHRITTIAGGGNARPSSTARPSREVTLDHPSAIAVDANGMLAITDNDGLLALDPTRGIRLILASGSGAIKTDRGPTAFFPDAVALSPQGIFVANESPKQLLLLSSTGQVVRSWGTYVASGALVAGSRGVYVADYGGFGVALVADGTLKTIVTSTQLSGLRPNAIAVARDGTVYTADPGSSGGTSNAPRLARISPDGTVTAVLPT